MKKSDIGTSEFIDALILALKRKIRKPDLVRYFVIRNPLSALREEKSTFAFIFDLGIKFFRKLFIDFSAEFLYHGLYCDPGRGPRAGVRFFLPEDALSPRAGILRLQEN